MDITIQPGKLQGTVTAIPSKSQAHRLLIAAAFACKPTTLVCPSTNQDIEATAQCLRALGADITRTAEGYHIAPVSVLPEEATLPCRESGSTLRFLLPIAGALGVRSTFVMEGRLPSRPLSPLWEELERMGCRLSRPTENTIFLEGKLKTGAYTIAGNVSSQYITGLLFALPHISGETSLEITGPIESAPYIAMTKEVLEHFAPGTIRVEGDWSNAAFFLAAQTLGSDIQVTNLNPNSCQGDRTAAALLPELLNHATICAANIPDLVPVLSVAAAANQGAVFTQIQRLRMKESDRVLSVIQMIQALGGQAWADESTLTVLGTGLSGGTVDSCNDHRIAMSAAIAATVCTQPVTILDAHCVQKSYPSFWAEYARLGGTYEQYIR